MDSFLLVLDIILITFMAALAIAFIVMVAAIMYVWGRDWPAITKRVRRK